MAAVFPGNVKTWTPVTDNTNTILASHINEAYEEIIALEGGLLTPSNSDLSSITKNNISLPSTTIKSLTKCTLNGNTVVNQLPDTVAGCESTSGWTASGSTIATDSANKYEGSNCLKITNTDNTGDIYRDILSGLDITKYYLITAYVKNGNGTNGIRLSVNCVGDIGLLSNSYSTLTSYTRQGIILQPSDFNTATQVILDVYVSGASTQYGYVDAIMLQEITSSEYALGVSALMEKYVYHRGAKSTSYQRIKSVGKNLFNKNLVDFGYFINYSTGELATDSLASHTNYFKINPNINYKISGKTSYYTGGSSGIAFYDVNKSYISGSNTVSATSPVNAVYARLTCSIVDLDTFQLEVGTTATTYEAYTETSVSVPLSLKSVSSSVSDIYDCNTGIHTQSISDVFELLGKNYSWDMAADDSAFKYVYTDTILSGYNAPINLVGKAIACKYNNKLLAIMSGSGSTGDQLYGSQVTNNRVVLTLFDSDTGWLEAWGPGASFTGMTWALLIRAYMNGWKLTTADLNVANCVWTGIASGTTQSGSGGYTTVTTTQDTGYTPYKMIYKLASPIVQSYDVESLIANPNGSVFIESVIKDIAVYNSSFRISNTSYPILNIESIHKVNSDGSLTRIAVNLITIASDGLSFTLSGASNGNQYQIIYYSKDLSTIGTLNYTYSTSIKSQIDNSLNLVRDLDKKVKYWGISLNALKLQAVGFTGGSTLVGLPQTSGTAQTYGLARLSVSPTVSNAVLDFGINNVMGAWIQFTSRADLSVNYPLLLNPNGGNIGIGTTDPTQKLTIDGVTLSGLPATSGTTQTNGLVRLINSTGSNAVLDMGTAGSSGVWIQSTSKADLSVKGKLLLNPNGGNVGIGTTLPAYNFDMVIYGAEATLHLGKYISEGSGGSYGHVFVGASIETGSKLTLEGKSGGDNIVFNNTGTKFGITGGNVGVGTTLPQAKFVVSNLGAEGFEVSPESNIVKLYAYDRVGANYEPFEYKGISHDFKYGASQVTAVLINSSGNVCVGSSAPNAKLDVRGTLAVGYGTDDTIAGTSRITISNPNFTETRGLSFCAYDSSKNPRAVIKHTTATDGTTQTVLFDSDYASGTAYANWTFLNAKVGIGVNPPTVDLHIQKNPNGAVSFLINNSNATAGQHRYSMVRVAGDNLAVEALLQAGKFNDNSIFAQVGTATNHNFAFITNSVVRATIDNSGNIGIGLTGPSYSLDIYELVTNASDTTFRVRTQMQATSNGTYYDKAVMIDCGNGIISASITNSGYLIGLDVSVFAATASFAGTLASQRAVWARAGINTATSGAVITSVYGVHAEILNAVAGTTITNAYGVYIQNTDTVGTITNRYDLYASSANAKNYFAGSVAIGTTSPLGVFDVCSGGLTLILGADSSAFTRTNNTLKISRIGLAHYTNAEERVCMMYSLSDTSGSGVYIGGGTSSMNAATEIAFYTAADNTTVTGTVRMTIDSAGKVGVGCTAGSNIRLEVRGPSSSMAGSGTTSYAMFRLGQSSTNAVLDFAFYDTYGAQIQSTDRTDLSAKYYLRLNPNGGKVVIGDSTSVGPGSFSIATVNTAPSGNANFYGFHVTPTSGGLVYIDALAYQTGNATMILRGYNNEVYHTYLYGHYDGKVGIGTTAPTGQLDISYGGLTLVLGADSNATTRTNTGAKVARIGGYHYTNAEEPICLMIIDALSNANNLYIGGGSSMTNTATSIRFYTAANNTTVTGTERLRIDANGNVGIGVTTFGANAAGAFAMITGTAPTAGVADQAHLFVKDVNAVAGKAGFHMMDEQGLSLVVPGVLIKGTTGDSATYFDGIIVINTTDNNIKIYGDGGWRQLATW